MHGTLHYILTKAADLGAMSGVVQRKFSDEKPVFRNMRATTDAASRMSSDMDPFTGDMLPLSRHMAGMSDDNAGMSHDMSTMSCDLAFVPDDMEAMTENYAALSLVSLLRSLNPLFVLRGLVAMLGYQLNEWYWRKMGLSDPVLRKIYQEADFDDLFTLVYVEVDIREFSMYDPRFKRTGAPVHFLLDFLVAKRVVRRRTKALLAVLLVLARKVLGFTEPKQFWALRWQFALQSDSGRSPLSPRPPPFAVC